MSSGLCLLACASSGALTRTLLLCGAVAQQGGAVVLLTPTPGLALRQTFFALEVVVRRDEDLAHELLRLESLALSRGAGVVYLDDERLDDSHAAAVRVLSQRLPVARYGPRLLGGAGGELPIDPYGPYGPCGPPAPSGPGAAGQGAAGDDEDEPGPLAAGGCFGLRYLPLHPGLRPLRDRREEGAEVTHVTITCGDDPDGVARAVRALQALGAWRPVLRVALLCDLAMATPLRTQLDEAVAESRHRVVLQPQAAAPQIGEALLADLAIVEGAERAGVAAYLGTPVLALSPDPADARRCEALARAGVAVHVPDFGEGQLPPALLGDLLWSLCADQGRRAALSREARRALDGYGAERIAAALLKLRAAHRRR